MGSLVTLVFALTYVGMALGRVPGLKLDRVGIALIALVVLLASEAVGIGALGAAIDAPTLILLFALMILSAQFGAAGFYEWCAAKITRAQGSPKALLALTVAVSGLLSAVLANDIVVFAMTPLLCLGVRRRGLDPRPFLAGLAGASNSGSAATVIGNPQNILIGQVGGLDFWTFLAACGVPALLALAITYAAVALVWGKELAAPATHDSLPELPPLDRWQLLKASLGTAALILLFATPLPRETGALVIAALLLLSRRMHSREVVGAVDWPLLLLFACLFVITHAFAGTGLAQEAIAALASRDLLPETIAVMAPMVLLASNSIGNVPFVILLLTIWPAPSEGALYGLALLSTLAGNLLITGSLANIITAERAAASGVRFGFMDHARAGVPMTLASLAVAALWLWLTSWMRWS
ncbi:MAG: putative transporter [Rhodospirillales bacterium]|jgi:Na+/H+ antiporter NhaD/arsenite permease-like protein|nr:putative transporter [Rhodospirillales bacterium]